MPKYNKYLSRILRIGLQPIFEIVMLNEKSYVNYNQISQADDKARNWNKSNIIYKSIVEIHNLCLNLDNVKNQSHSKALYIIKNKDFSQF